MIRRPPNSTLTDPLVPYTTLFRSNIAADAIEALCGALYLDQGIDTARRFILAHWGDMIEGQAAAPKHPKAALQEWALARGRRPPEYEIVSREGPDHAPRFRVAVSVGRSEEHTSELQSLMRISYAVFCLKKKN